MFAQSFNSRKGGVHRPTNPLGISIWGTLKLFFELEPWPLCGTSRVWYLGEHICMPVDTIDNPSFSTGYSPKTKYILSTLTIFCT